MRLTSSPLFLLVALIAVAITGLNGCGTQTNKDNVAVNTNANTVPLNTPTPTPPPCDDNAINQELVTVFTDSVNQGGKDGFKDIQKTVNFYSRNCEVHLWGYTKSVGRFKKFLKMMGNVRRISTASLPESFENLYIDRSDYPYLPSLFGGNCSSPYKKCGDICIPETDSCWTDFAR
jgi:hypothetical protein